MGYRAGMAKKDKDKDPAPDTPDPAPDEPGESVPAAEDDPSLSDQIADLKAEGAALDPPAAGDVNVVEVAPADPDPVQLEDDRVPRGSGTRRFLGVDGRR